MEIPIWVRQEMVIPWHESKSNFKHVLKKVQEDVKMWLHHTCSKKHVSETVAQMMLLAVAQVHKMILIFSNFANH